MSKNRAKFSNRKAIDTPDDQESGHRHVFTMECIDSVLSNLKGEILTIADASLPEGRQLEAIKDLIHTSFKKSRWDVIDIAANEMPDVYGNYGLNGSILVPINQLGEQA